MPQANTDLKSVPQAYMESEKESLVKGVYMMSRVGSGECRNQGADPVLNRG